MAQEEIIIKNTSELDTAAELFLSKIGSSKNLAFYGDMGSGKTTFIKAVCKKLEVTDEVTSPTFSIVNEYNTRHNYKVYHFDFYRIKKEEEIFDFGYEEYLYANDYCLMEWPELAENLLPENTLKISVNIGDNDQRILTF